MRTRVCVYGVRTIADGLAAAEHGADAVGLLFLRGAARAVEPEDAWEIVQRLPPLVSTIGVFANEDVDRFCEVEESCPTDYSQLDGEEDEETVRQCGPRVLKTVRLGEGRDGAAASEREAMRWATFEEIDGVVLAAQDGRFDEPALEAAARIRVRCGKPIILGGDLTASTVAFAVERIRPWAAAMMVAPGPAESVHGAAVAEFVRAVRRGDGG